MSNTRVIKYILTIVAVLCTVYQAGAGVRITHPDARLRIATETLPDALERGQWSLLVWMYAPESITEPSSLISIGGRLTVTADAQGLSVHARHAYQGTMLRIESPLRAGRWHLLAISMDHRGDTARAWLATQPDSSTEGEIASDSGRLGPIGTGRSLMRAAISAGDPVIGPRVPGGFPATLSRENPVIRDPALVPDTTGLVIGALPAGLRAAMLQYDALTIRDHPLNDVDVDAVWRSRDYYGPYRQDANDSGGLMNGWAGAHLLAFHGMCSRPNGPGGDLAKASWPGAEVSTSNVMMLTRPTPIDPRFSIAFRTVGSVEQAVGVVHRSRLEPGLDGFFRIEPPPFDAPTEPVGPIGPKAAQLVNGPQGLVRVLVSGNSRGTRGTVLPQRWPENFAHGLVQAKLSQTAGVLMRLATLRDPRGGWFGLDTSTSTPETHNVRSLHARDDAWADFTRFGSGTLPSASLGPGAATSIGPGGLYRLRCRPEPGSLLVADAPLIVRSTLLAFPGSSPLVWYPERGDQQDGPELRVGDPVTVPLDTTRVAHQMSARDAFETDTTLVLDAVLDVRVGDAIVVLSGGAVGAVSAVVDVRAEPGTTVIELSHPFGGTPTAGAEFRIGPWRFESVEHRFDAVPDGDDRTWRGQVLTAPSDDLLGVMVYSVSAWRPDVDGFIIGSAGQGGDGYEPQLERAIPGATAAWAAESAVDVWFVTIAGQSSSPVSMSDYVADLRTAVGDTTEFVWASDGVHGHTTHEHWHNYLADEAESSGVAAVFAVSSPRVGSFLEQAASGMRADDSHFTPFGNRVIAEAWLDQLRKLAAGPCLVADYNGDGGVDVFDLLNFQTDWEAGNPKADLDADGRFLIFDYLVLLTAIDQCD